MRVLFFGTPDFALTCLCGLHNSEHTVVGVVTQPDKPKGRGYTLTPPPVKVWAEQHSLPVYQPQSLRDGALEPVLREIDPDVICVVAYGKILPKYILDYPKYGCINVHSSLLPAYRGAAPMQRAIMDGCTETGITTMYMSEGLDTGDMLERLVCPIGENDNFEDIHDRLADMGAELLPHTLTELAAGTLTPVPQTGEASYAEKITRGDCLIDFNMSARVIHDKVRALSPIPLAYTHHSGKLLKIVTTSLTGRKSDARPGTVISLDEGKIFVACGDGVIAVTRLLPEGKGRMDSCDYIRGRKIKINDILGE